VARAAERLKTGAMTVETAAHAAGFSNVRHFRALFRSEFGVSPAAMRG
jgi:transcriptional regulator GlxA family with amidase domain